MQQGTVNHIWPDKSFQLLVNDKGMYPENKDPTVDKRYFIKVSNPDNVIIWRLRKYLTLQEFDPFYLNNHSKLQVYDDLKNGDYLIVMNIGSEIEWLEMYSL